MRRLKVPNVPAIAAPAGHSVILYRAGHWGAPAVVGVLSRGGWSLEREQLRKDGAQHIEDLVGWYLCFGVLGQAFDLDLVLLRVPPEPIEQGLAQDGDDRLRSRASGAVPSR